MQRTPSLLIVLIVLALSFSLIRRNDILAEAHPYKQKDARAERYEQAKRHFPTVDYNEPTLPDTEENRAKKEKKKRFNELGNWVFANTRPNIAENRSSANYFDFPALPVAKSDIILIGVVGESAALLSENKKNVFSEFKVVVETVLKTSDQAMQQSSVVTVNRMGAFVRYPGGQTVLYQRAGMYMPQVGGRYLFFLNSLNKYDYGILTAYELTEAGVIPLDMSTEFFALEGKSESEILRTLHSLSKSQEQQPSRKAQPRPLDENRFPIADYGAPESSDPCERAKRHAKGKKYDKSHWNIYPDAQSSMARTHPLDPDLPALPIAESTAVVIGRVTDAKAFLSNDKTGVYSVFNFQIDEVIKNSSNPSLTAASSIEVERDGGRVRFPNGRTLIFVSTNMPQVGLRYVLFLKIPQGQTDFQILTGYELRDGRVYPLDDLPNLSVYENADEATFLNQLRNKRG